MKDKGQPVEQAKKASGGGWFGSSKKNDAKTSESKETKVSDEVMKAERELKKLKEEYVPIDFSSYTIDDYSSEILSKRTSEEGLS